MSEDETIHMLQSYVGMSKKDNHRPILDKAIETLLDLYQQEKEKNRELLKEYNKKLYADWENAISKDKIRDFIKKETFEGTYSFDLISAKRLKELLE